MPSKVTGPARARRYRERLEAHGIKVVSLSVPISRIEELRTIAAEWTRQQFAEAHRERVARLRNEPQLPLDRGAAND